MNAYHCKHFRTKCVVPFLISLLMAALRKLAFCSRHPVSQGAPVRCFLGDGMIKLKIRTNLSPAYPDQRNFTRTRNLFPLNKPSSISFELTISDRSYDSFKRKYLENCRPAKMSHTGSYHNSKPENEFVHIV